MEKKEPLEPRKRGEFRPSCSLHRASLAVGISCGWGCPPAVELCSDRDLVSTGPSAAAAAAALGPTIAGAFSAAAGVRSPDTFVAPATAAAMSMIAWACFSVDPKASAGVASPKRAVWGDVPTKRI